MNMLKPLAAASAAAMIAVTAACASHHGEMQKAEKVEKPDIVDTAIGAGSFTTLVAAIQAAGLEETLRGDGPFTVFAPTDDAFAKLPAGTIDTLLAPENKEQLAAILTYHVVAGKVKSSDLAGKTLTADSVQGGALSIDATDGVMVNNATVIQADIYARNGVVHVIDTVLLPE